MRGPFVCTMEKTPTEAVKAILDFSINDDDIDEYNGIFVIDITLSADKYPDTSAFGLLQPPMLPKNKGAYTSAMLIFDTFRNLSSLNPTTSWTSGEGVSINELGKIERGTAVFCPGYAKNNGSWMYDEYSKAGIFCGFANDDTPLVALYGSREKVVPGSGFLFDSKDDISKAAGTHVEKKCIKIYRATKDWFVLYVNRYRG
ncbi:MAG: hypothetical protein FWH56_04690 [Betaproteobacteria bacterium]|nr:hypothetical protein [Betaproteobacteria bacterium]